MKAMKTPTYIYAALASLAVLVVPTLRIGPHLPEPFHLLDGGWLIQLGLAVYAAALVVVGLTVIGKLRIREIVSSERIVFVAAAAIIVVYCVYVTVALVGLSQATDL